MEQTAPIIKLIPTAQNIVPRPYTDTTYVVPEGIYALPTIEQLTQALKEIYAKQGLEVINVKPAEITLRKYHDELHKTDAIADSERTEGTDSGQPAD